jgi:hypothetical protein
MKKTTAYKMRRVTQRDEVPSCKPIPGRFNQTEGINIVRYPSGDSLQQTQRGMISPHWNNGLRNSQRKFLTVDNYNSGCLGPNNCVPDPNLDPDLPPGFICPGKTSGLNDEMKKAFRFLNAPLAPFNADFKPPEYVLRKNDAGGISTDANSVVGWKVMNNGQFAWQASARSSDTCV